MSHPSFTLTVHMVSSLDGYIAKPDNSIEWFDTKDHFEGGLTNEQAYAAMPKVDCYIMGSKTYELAMELSKNHGWPYGETPTIVLTSRELPGKHDHVEFYAGDLNKLVEELLKPRFGNVWIVGGANITTAFLRAGLVDRIIHNILPILLGEGVPFYDQLKKEVPLHLMKVTTYQMGMVELIYGCKL